MHTIWKFPIEIIDTQLVPMPLGSEIIHVGPDPVGQPCLWALVDTERVQVRRSVEIVGTGDLGPSITLDHVGSFVQGPFVWHVFA